MWAPQNNTESFSLTADLLLDREQLEAEAAVHVLQRFDSTEAQIFKQNHALLLQPGTHRNGSFFFSGLHLQGEQCVL